VAPTNGWSLGSRVGLATLGTTDNSTVSFGGGIPWLGISAGLLGVSGIGYLANKKLSSDEE
jgi:hypothetical protein